MKNQTQRNQNKSKYFQQELQQATSPTKPKNERLLPRHSVGVLECFCVDLVMFIISGFLPGEYLLRVFPLICKSMKSRRLSLSLLGSSSPPNPSSTTFYDLEGPTQEKTGAKDFNRIEGHTLIALKVTLWSAPSNQCFSCLEKLVIPSNYQDENSFSFDQFPRLTKLEVTCCTCTSTLKQVLNWIWKLPLVELSLLEYPIKGDNARDAVGDSDSDPPTFARTLCSLKVDDNSFLDALAPYCKSIQSLTTPDYHNAIMVANPGLTSLMVKRARGGPPIDLTQYTQLVELKFRGSRSLFSHGTHSHLVHVLLDDPDLDSASFLPRCPSLKHVTLECFTWEGIVKITTILDPTKCKRLTLVGAQLPSLDQVKRLILDRGFQVNEEALLLYTTNGQQKWSKVMEMAPQIKDWTLLRGTMLNVLFSHHHRRPFLTSFSALSAININVSDSWSEESLASVVQCCPVLKKLVVSGSEFWGGVQLHSSSLRTLDLQFTDNYSHFDLKLPSLTHLKLCGRAGEDLLLRGLLNGDPLIQLPLLSVLKIKIFGDGAGRRTLVSCKVGHPSLSTLRVITHNRFSGPLAFSTLNIASLPCLKSATIIGLSPTAKLVLRLVGSCKVYVGNHSFGSYSKVADPDFQKQVYYDNNQQKWVEGDIIMKKITKNQRKPHKRQARKK